jgi:FdhD protein
MARPETGSAHFRFSVLKPGSQANGNAERAIVAETPIAIEYNGIGYAVMMATPIDLNDFAIGFSLSEGLIDAPHQILSIDSHSTAQGRILRVQLPSGKIQKVIDRARQRVSESSCGLCGMDNLDEVMRPLSQVTAAIDLQKIAIFSALNDLRAHQPLSVATGASHAAAFCTPDGKILMVREDVGRHNALDKLFGALATHSIVASSGFVLLTARCSFELVQKTILANCPALVTISAATDLALTTAAKHKLTLISLARPDGVLTNGILMDAVLTASSQND